MVRFIEHEPGQMTNAVDSVGYKLKVGMASSSSTITALPSDARAQQVQCLRFPKGSRVCLWA
jgi:hypothetical protein